MSEEVEARDGTLLGLLPEARTCEARLAADGIVIRGKVATAVGEIGEFKDKWEGRGARLQLRITRVRSSERFVLLGVEEPSAALSGD